MKNRVVVFTRNNARIITNPPNLSDYEGKENCIINPDLSEVTGRPPHLWKLRGGKILPLTYHEEQMRMKDIENIGVINEETRAIEPEPFWTKERKSQALALTGAICLLMTILLRFI